MRQTLGEMLNFMLNGFCGLVDVPEHTFVTPKEEQITTWPKSLLSFVRISTKFRESFNKLCGSSKGDNKIQATTEFLVESISS